MMEAVEKDHGDRRERADLQEGILQGAVQVGILQDQEGLDSTVLQDRLLLVFCECPLLKDHPFLEDRLLKDHPASGPGSSALVVVVVEGVSNPLP